MRRRARAGGRKTGRSLSEKPHQFVVDDFDDLLAGGNALEDLLTNAGGLDAFDEFAGDLEVDVGREQGGAHLLEGVGHIFFAELACAAEVAESGGKFIGKGRKHARAGLGYAEAKQRRRIPVYGRIFGGE